MRSPYIFIMLLCCGLLVSIAALVNGVVDPFRFYHAPWFEIGYSDNQRYQNPGLARSTNYESVLIGTSHTEPFITSEISQAMGHSSLNLSISGSLITEQSLMLAQVLEQGKVRRVLWEINYPSFSFGSGVSDPATFPWFLFQPGAETPFRYLLSWDTFTESMAAIGGERVQHLDQLHRWDLSATFSADRVLANWDFMTTRWNDELRDFWSIFAISEDELLMVFQQEVEQLIRRYPEVRFDLLLVPSTWYDYANDLQVGPHRLDKRLRLRDETVRLAREVPNAHVWDFQKDGWMMNDLNHYKDMDHFGQGIIREILKQLGTPENASNPDEAERTSNDLPGKVVAHLERFCRQQAGRCQSALLENLDAFRQRHINTKR